MQKRSRVTLPLLLTDTTNRSAEQFLGLPPTADTAAPPWPSEVFPYTRHVILEPTTRREISAVL